MARVVPIHWISPDAGFAACHTLELSRVPCVGELIVIERALGSDCDETCPRGVFEVLALRHTPHAGEVDADIYIAPRSMNTVLEPLEAWLSARRPTVRLVDG